MWEHLHCNVFVISFNFSCARQVKISGKIAWSMKNPQQDSCWIFSKRKEAQSTEPLKNHFMINKAKLVTWCIETSSHISYKCVLKHLLTLFSVRRDIHRISPIFRLVVIIFSIILLTFSSIFRNTIVENDIDIANVSGHVDNIFRPTKGNIFLCLLPMIRFYFTGCFQESKFSPV